MRATLEVCVDSLADAKLCDAMDVTRIELCAALPLGGLTPSRGLMAAAAALSVPVWAMIRPRAGDFAFDTSEVALMCDDIRAARDAGLSGVVLGAAQDRQHLDIAAMAQFRDACDGLPMALHRVIDTLHDPVAAVSVAADLGCVRILTSGGAQKAPQGAATLARMQDAADGRIDIMAGSGLRSDNLAELAAKTGIRAFHASCSRLIPGDPALATLGFVAPQQARTSASEIAKMQRILTEISD